MSIRTCSDHTEMADTYIGWLARAEWFENHGYHQMRCEGCNRFRIWVSPDGVLVDSFVAEFRRVS